MHKAGASNLGAAAGTNSLRQREGGEQSRSNNVQCLNNGKERSHQDSPYAKPSPATNKTPAEAYFRPTNTRHVPKPGNTSASNPHSRPSTKKPLSTSSGKRKLKPEIRYFIVLQGDRGIVEEHWPDGNLSTKTLDELFEEILSRTIETEILSICFTLRSSQKGFVERCFSTGKNDQKSFEETKEDFAENIRTALKRGITKFEILMKGEMGDVSEQESVGVEESEDEFEV
ncbi:hypothetical protein P7C71_g4756, partial [Lecanoromycetidae sp. Uapishka_2]